jgi:hypothetical protein
MPDMRGLCFVLLALMAAAAATLHSGSTPVEVEMQNVDLHLTPDVAVHVRHLRGRFVASEGRNIPFLDEPRSYTVAIDSGEVDVDLASLNAIMTRALLGHSNLRSLRVSIDDEGRLQQDGVVARGIRMPFEIHASAGATSSGQIRIHPESVKGFGLPVGRVLRVLGTGIGDLLEIEPGRGVSVDANDLLLDPARLLPPPAMNGKVTAVRIERDGIVQVFGQGTRQRMSPPATAKNYIYWRGGSLSFGKLTMSATDLELIDEDPSDPFDFSVDRWNEQLVAGYSKVTPERGLKSHMPDYNDLRRPSKGRGRSADSGK